MIEYIDVHKAFDVPVLSGVSLTVETGETLSIVGPSGTGKSVLLKTTNGLLVPDRGDVRIDGDLGVRLGRRAPCSRSGARWATSSSTRPSSTR